MAVGFYINKLILTGTAKRQASIEFKRGLNVVAGASDTGKTFIFQCIDYMMGGQNPPKQIEESKGFERIFLVIETYEGQAFTLERPFGGGAFQIKQGDADSNSPYETYAERLTNDSKNISTFLLSLCELENVQLKINALNKKARLSFRDVAGFCLVDEKTIITEDSPAYYANESTAKTKGQSLFYYFLTGEDAGDLQELEDPKILKSKIAGKIELVKELIGKTQQKLDEFKGENVEQLEKDLEAQYEQLNLEYRTSLVEIDKLRNQRAEYFKNVTKLESKLLFNRELLGRFDLLDKHYDSDRKRLEFISEGSFLLSQLNDISCPICGGEIKDNHASHVETFRKENENFEESLVKELEKITLKQTELIQTTTQLKNDITKQTKSLANVRAKIVEIDNTLNNSLTPVSKSLRERLNIINSSRTRLDRYKNLKKDIDNYNDHLNHLNELATKKVQANEEAIAQQNQIFTEYCQTVEQVLNDWQYPNITSLIFDSRYKAFDIVINGNPRSANGKGYRAITYSAFVYALMKFCQAKNHNHPNMLVLDSPLTTFKAKDGPTNNSEEVGKDVEYSFFETLSTAHDNEQIILLENKEPDESLLPNMNYIHFSGLENVGRQGFFE